MGRILDTLFFSCLTFLVMLIALSYTDKDFRLCAMLALAASLCVSSLMLALYRRRPGLSLHQKRKAAEKAVKQMIYEDAARAHIDAAQLLKKRYPIHSENYLGGRMEFLHGKNDERSILCVIQKLKAAPDDVLNVWKQYGEKADVKTMVIAAPGKSDKDTRIQAYRLSSPEAVFLDKAQLIHLMKRYQKVDRPAKAESKIRLSRALRGYISGRRAGRYALFSALFILYYLFTGAIFYLFSGVFLCLVTVYSFFAERGQENLI